MDFQPMMQVLLHASGIPLEINKRSDLLERHEKIAPLVMPLEYQRRA